MSDVEKFSRVTGEKEQKHAMIENGQEDKFEEMRKKLLALREENEKQMVIITNSIEQLIHDKKIVEDTFAELRSDTTLVSEIPAFGEEK